MFDFGFTEMLVIGVVALVVIGPERLPKVARTAGHLFGRLQRYVSDVKSEINREMELDELKKIQQNFYEAARSVEASVNEQAQEIEASVNSTMNEARGSFATGTSPPPMLDAQYSVPAAEDLVQSSAELSQGQQAGASALSDATTPVPDGDYVAAIKASTQNS